MPISALWMSLPSASFRTQQFDSDVNGEFARGVVDAGHVKPA
jgi:hypothetical protein